MRPPSCPSSIISFGNVQNWFATRVELGWVRPTHASRYWRYLRRQQLKEDRPSGNRNIANSKRSQENLMNFGKDTFSIVRVLGSAFKPIEDRTGLRKRFTKKRRNYAFSSQVSPERRSFARSPLPRFAWTSRIWSLIMSSYRGTWSQERRTPMGVGKPGRCSM
jgi:hypothetical protein